MPETRFLPAMRICLERAPPLALRAAFLASFLEHIGRSRTVNRRRPSFCAAGC